MVVLVRSWNLFHGNANPPERGAFLEEMVRLVTADRPDVVCLQESPVWALPRLGEWSGATAVADVAARPLLPSWAARPLTELHHGLLRSALTGQANALLLAPGLRPREHACLVLNPRRLPLRRQRRICQAVRVEVPNGHTLLVANLHATNDPRAAEPELLRAAVFADSLARPGEPLILAGDFNLRATSGTLAELTSSKWGFSAPGPGIDHILVRGATPGPLEVWSLEKRRQNGRVLSDHAPVELSVDV